MPPALAITTIAVVTLATAARLNAQEPAAPTGPVIADFGSTFAVPDATLLPAPDQDLKLRFDVGAGAEPGQLNAGFETVARFLNMHARGGVAHERLKTALVIHGTAGKDTLASEACRRRYGQDNPNLACWTR